MKIHWFAAGLVAAALATACGDRGAQNTENSDPNAAPPATSTAAPAEPNRPDTSSTNRDESTASDRAADRRVEAPRSSAGRLESTRPSARDDDRPSRSTAPNRAASDDNRPAAPAPSPPRVEFREVRVPAGTALPLELLTPLSSETAAVETPVRARLRQGIMVDGATALPAGSVLSGNVTEVDGAGRVRGRSRLVFSFTSAQVNGAREDIRTNPLVFEGEATKGEDATKIGAGAGIGAVIGGIVGGGKGAAKGAAIGGAAGTGAVLATKGKNVTLAEGADIPATLADAFTVRVPVR